MHKRVAFGLAVLIGFTVNAQINLQGVISNATGKPIANAIVTLTGQALKDTTGTDGKYSFAKAVAVRLPAIVPQIEEIAISNGVLKFTLKNPSPVKVAFYDVAGNLLKKEDVMNATAGEYCFNIAKNCLATKLLVIKATIGKSEVSFPYMTLNSGKFTLNPSAVVSSAVSNGQLMKMAAVVDTIKVTANGFQAKSVAITSYDNQQQDISLDSLKRNAPAGSTGCGKDLSTLKSGTYTITSAGLSRQYIIDIPTSYDKNNPYRLIFGMHCYGSSMQGVASDKYYQLKRFADSTKTPCIFVAPNGTGSGTPLWNQDEKDHTFFDDMLKLFKEKLCVDTTRVFCCGFSYGAMFSYSLSTNHQKQLRAVACYAPANWNIYLPTNTHEPIAFMSTTGISDPNCPLVHDETAKEGGRYCSIGHAEDNGCTIPTIIPMAIAGSKSHVCYEYQDGKEGYPVKLYTFDGGHQCGPMDGVSGDNTSKSWIPGETWKFFMQF